MKKYLSILLILAVIICEGCSYFENDRIFYAANDSCTIYQNKTDTALKYKKMDSVFIYFRIVNMYVDSMIKVLESDK